MRLRIPEQKLYVQDEEPPSKHASKHLDNPLVSWLRNHIGISCDSVLSIYIPSKAIPVYHLEHGYHGSELLRDR
jgi:hypothetical protein